MSSLLLFYAVDIALLLGIALLPGVMKSFSNMPGLLVLVKHKPVSNADSLELVFISFTFLSPLCIYATMLSLLVANIHDF